MSGLFLPGFAIWRAAETADGRGGFARAFLKAADAPGRLTPLRAAEQVAADRQRGVVSYRFACPASTDLRPGDEVRGGGRIVTVEAVTVTSTGRRKEAVCVERG